MNRKHKGYNMPVMVYEDPITEQRPEGVAYVVRRVAGTVNGLGRFMVRFPDNGHLYERAIKEPLRPVKEET